MGLVNFVLDQMRRSELSDFATQLPQIMQQDPTGTTALSMLAKIDPTYIPNVIENQRSTNQQQQKQSALASLFGGQPKPAGTVGDYAPNAPVPQALPTQNFEQPQQSPLAKYGQLVAAGLMSPKDAISLSLEEQKANKPEKIGPESALGKLYADMQSGILPQEVGQSAVQKETTFETPQQKRTLELEQSKKKADASFRALSSQSKIIDSNIEDAKKLASGMSTGMGSLLSIIPETDASDLSSILKTIKADAAFTTLQEMRNNSPTGGALGSVSERELALLESAKTSLEQSQSKEQFLRKLEEYKQVRKKALNNVKQAYKETYGEDPSSLEENRLSFGDLK